MSARHETIQASLSVAGSNPTAAVLLSGAARRGEEDMPSFDQIASQLEHQAIELPSWAFGNSGTRVKVFPQAGAPRDPEEKIADAAKVHELTGLPPSVALHIPWDKVDDYDKLSRYAIDHGVRLGTINSNTFQDDDYMLGSLTHHDQRVRDKAVDHLYECIEIM